MKKIEAILKGKQGDLAQIKEKKIRKYIEVALLNAEDDLQTKALEYEATMREFGCECGDYCNVLDKLVSIKRDTLDIELWVQALKQVQADLDVEVKVGD